MGWRYNPFTHGLDYYQGASEIDLGDVGDVDTSGAVDGSLLSYNGAQWAKDAQISRVAGGIDIAGNLDVGGDLGVTGSATVSVDQAITGDLTVDDITVNSPSNIYALSHDSFADYVAEEHLLVGAIDHNSLLNYVAGEHLLVGAIDHNSLLNYVAEEHLLVGAIDHNSLLNYVAEEHLLVGAIDHNSLLNYVAGEHLLVGAIDHNSLLNYVAGEHFTQANIVTVGTIGTGVWQGTPIANAYVAGLNQDCLTSSTPQFVGVTYSDGTDSHVIKAIQETGLGGRLTIGLDETTRTLIICDVGDIAVDFALAPSTNPILCVFSADRANYSYLDKTKVGGDSTYFSVQGKTLQFIVTQDLAAGDFFDFKGTDNTVELTATNVEQAWLKITPYINQTGTANYIGLLMDVTETGAVGTSDKLMALRVATVDKFTVSPTGLIDAIGGIHNSGAALLIQDDAAQDVKLFASAGAGENPAIYIYGDLTGTAYYGKLWFDTDGIFKIDSNYAGLEFKKNTSTKIWIGDYIKFYADAFMSDGESMVVGTNFDGGTYYDEVGDDSIVFWTKDPDNDGWGFRCSQTDADNAGLIKIKKVVVTAAELTAAGLTDSINVAVMPANSLLISAKYILDVQFSNGALTDVDCTIGLAGDNAGLIDPGAHNLISDAVGTEYTTKGAYWDGTDSNCGTFFSSAGTTWVAYFTAVGNDWDEISTGQITFYIMYIDCQGI